MNNMPASFIPPEIYLWSKQLHRLSVLCVTYGYAAAATNLALKIKAVPAVCLSQLLRDCCKF
jgi:hypothetical protein